MTLFNLQSLVMTLKMQRLSTVILRPNSIYEIALKAISAFGSCVLYLQLPGSGTGILL